MPDVPGVFAVDKPLGISSARAVAIVKKWARQTLGEKNIKVGHGGTLDPLASGVLVIAVGRAYTREIAQYVSADKEYVARVTLGSTSATDDAEGPIVKRAGVSVPSDVDVLRVCAQFEGDILQMPPAFSALKKDGERAYTKARRGEDVVLQPRPVHIAQIEVLAYVYPDVQLRIVCGKGTYIRALARDIGEALDTGAYMSALRRTRVGVFTVADTFDMDAFEG